MSSEQQRTVGDLEPDREVWIADHARNRSCAHLDRNCPKVRDSEPRTRRVLHPNLRLCKYCDDAYEVSRPGGRSPAWDLRQQGGGADE
jgi:hypothetical protein